jgi:serine/threonine-protein kinase
MAPTPAGSTLLPALIAARYLPIRLLGRGGVGAVYEVEHVRTGARLALKVLHDRAVVSPVAIERFRREARASARVRSEYVVSVVDADVSPELGGAPFLVMELLEGQDLQALCGEEPQPPDVVLDWLAQVARGLDRAHALGVVHRDLKPENLFLARRHDAPPIVKILDFGLAQVACERSLTADSADVRGTPCFMAPEQADPHGDPVTASADRFSLGLIAHKLLTGRHYWQTRTLVQLVREICIEPMPAPSERGSALGEAFDAWFLRACHRDPSRRFESASAQIAALAGALGAVGVREPAGATAPPVSVVARPTPRAAPAVVAALALALVAITGSVLMQTRHPTALHSTTATNAPAYAPTAANPPVVAIAPSAPASAPSSAVSRPPAPLASPEAADSRRPEAHPVPAPRPSLRDPWADQH